MKVRETIMLYSRPGCSDNFLIKIFHDQIFDLIHNVCCQLLENPHLYTLPMLHLYQKGKHNIQNNHFISIKTWMTKKKTRRMWEFNILIWEIFVKEKLIGRNHLVQLTKSRRDLRAHLLHWTAFWTEIYKKVTKDPKTIR